MLLCSDSFAYDVTNEPVSVFPPVLGTMFMDIEGVVKQVVLVVPHSYVYIDVKKGAETETWVLEATSRNGLEKIGVTRDYLKVGDAVKARCHQLKDGSNGCLLGFLKGPDGVVKNWDGDTGPVPSL